MRWAATRRLAQQPTDNLLKNTLTTTHAQRCIGIVISMKRCAMRWVATKRLIQQPTYNLVKTYSKHTHNHPCTALRWDYEALRHALGSDEAVADAFAAEAVTGAHTPSGRQQHQQVCFALEKGWANRSRGCSRL
jgi:hypothetical protein